MTDDEIIKALDCERSVGLRCSECPLRDYEGDCSERAIEDAFDLVVRQKAEIKSLSKTLADRECSCGELATALQTANELLKTEKSEAIKEFAQSLKKYAKELQITTDTSLLVVGVGRIDSLAKEMTEV